MRTIDVLGIIAVLALVLIAAVLAAAETALTNLNRAQTAAIDDEEQAASLSWLLRNRERALSPVWFVSTACHLGAAAISTMVLRHYFNRWVTVAALTVQVLLMFMVAEALPRGLALHNPSGVARRLAPIVRAMRAVPPLRWLAGGLVWLSNLALPAARRHGPVMSDEELIATATAAVEADIIEAAEGELIASVIAFGDTVVRGVMTPRPDMVTVPRTTTISEALEICIDSGFSRLPVTRASSDDIVGVVHAKALAQAARAGRGSLPVSGASRQPLWVPETKPVEALLRQMQAARLLMAIVVDEYGGTAGLVTIEDLVEELVGEIVDEFDHEEPLFALEETGDIVVHGRMPVLEVNALLDRELPNGDWDTVGGLIFGSMGRLPSRGETLQVDGVRLLVEEMEGRRITRVRLAVADAAESRPPAAPDRSVGADS
ncbi:MAG: HlyC/CorC family transporter [Acidimicrobiales bacterium]|nr:HlyC/CorC family transporter [Acidimicrobiales bacterium]